MHALPITMAFLLFASVLLAGDPEPLIFPSALRTGDTIAMVAPAGDLDRDRIEWAIGQLRAKGYLVKVPATLYRRRGYLAGTDTERADELMAAFRDDSVQAVFCGGGGYGTTRMLDVLDYDVIRAHPKILTGFSDVTGLHLAVHRKAGLVTFHSPFLGPVLEPRENPFTGDYFWRAILAESFVPPGGSPRAPGYGYEMPADGPRLETLSPGVARGRLTGGNLSLIAATMGTPYEIQTAGRILFIEDWHEEPYRIDRFLSQLRLAGKLKDVAGVIIGAFVDCEAKDSKKSLALDQVFDDYFRACGVPVISHFPVGHFKYNATLPLGVLAELNADRRELRLLEDPVVLGPASSRVTSAPATSEGAP